MCVTKKIFSGMAAHEKDNRLRKQEDISDSIVQYALKIKKKLDNIRQLTMRY